MLFSSLSLNFTAFCTRHFTFKVLGGRGMGQLYHAGRSRPQRVVTQVDGASAVLLPLLPNVALHNAVWRGMFRLLLKYTWPQLQALFSARQPPANTRIEVDKVRNPYQARAFRGKIPVAKVWCLHCGAHSGVFLYPTTLQRTQTAGTLSATNTTHPKHQRRLLVS